MSAVHEIEHLQKAVAAFAQAGRELGLLPEATSGSQVKTRP
jgi:hypothetical protein